MDKNPPDKTFQVEESVGAQKPSSEPLPETPENNTLKTPEEIKPTQASKNETVNKNLKIAVLSLIFFLIFAGLGFQFLGRQKPKTPSPSQPAPTQFVFKAEVVYLSGEASKIVNDRKIEIKEGDILNEGDMVQTEENSRLVLSLDEGTIIRLGENTQLTLFQLTPSMTSVIQARGAIFARVEKDETHKFLTKAGEVSVESLGTAFSVEKQDDVNVKVFESKVVIKQEGQEEVELEKDKEWNSNSKKVEKIDKQKLATNEFIDWSLKEEKLISPTPTPKPAGGSGISLSGSATENGVYLSWTVSNNLDTSQGFKIIKNLTGNPTYPPDPMQYLSNSETRSYLWKITDGQTWHFRVCQFTGNGCGLYSNEIVVKTPSTCSKCLDSDSEIKSQVSSISLSAEKVSENQARLTWSVNGTAPNGFKVLWSETPAPTYPPRGGDQSQWLPSENKEYLIKGLVNGKTYYFRICEYLSGTCGTYSNQTSLNF